MKEICEQFKITHRNSTAYLPQMNGVVEAANKNIKRILRKMIDNYKCWHENLPYALLETVIPAEVEIQSLRIIQEAELSDAEWRITRAFNKKVRVRTFEVGQLVLKHIFPHQEEYKGKFAPNWQGQYVVHKVLSRGALVLAEMDGQLWRKAINSDAVKRYYI
ncbi:uncharacterized protein [Solanum tuberosum]|uniref:uncharacterized protein n=1 Tax=Solanum tuberosum TaxID=4113 RepID=UPI000739FBFD|nr:PREDICTED: uncharacterized protein LOC107062642 [Solanum tuberosum]